MKGQQYRKVAKPTMECFCHVPIFHEPRTWVQTIATNKNKDLYIYSPGSNPNIAKSIKAIFLNYVFSTKKFCKGVFVYRTIQKSVTTKDITCTFHNDNTWINWLIKQEHWLTMELTPFKGASSIWFPSSIFPSICQKEIHLTSSDLYTIRFTLEELHKLKNLQCP